MARDWAYAFYHSKAWKLCRKAFGDSKHWICQRCGKPGNTVHHRKWLTPANINDPQITLGWWNLELLCADCHNHEHFPELSPTREGFAFDENGDLVPVPSPHATDE